MNTKLVNDQNNTGEMQQQVLPFALIEGEAVLDKPQDLFIPPDALKIVLENFEGPLDLLLYLIRKQKLDIVALPIAQITQQYLYYIELMTELKMELAAEYLAMAAILAEIKSRLLLPKLPIEAEEEDPRAELVRRLQAYEQIKKAAQQLDELPRLERDLHTVNVLFTPQTTHHSEEQIPLTALVEAMQNIIKRSEAFEHHHIQPETLSTRERMSAILTQLQQAPEQKFVEFSQFFTLNEGKSGIVVTFLAILELIKESLIECIQNQHLGLIQIRLSAARK